jgi:hypothetical protein
MKMKTNELSGTALDWAVAKAQGYGLSTLDLIYDIKEYAKYKPSSDWSFGGPIIEREQMNFKWVGATDCRASIDWLDEDFFEAFGPTPLIAAMRCYVASKLGAEVDVPEELR